MKVAIPVEKVSDCAALGRFTLRDEGKTIALGRVIRYIPNNKSAVVRPVVVTNEAASATGVDKVAPVVFNLETGATEAMAKPLAGISEEIEGTD
jgi:hypothetical protein